MQPIEINKKRIVYIDMLRWIAILSVIMLHCISQYFIDLNLFGTKTWWEINIISSCSRFGVPIFFMVSGYLLLSDTREKSISEFLKGRLLKILLPFFTWNIIYYIYFALERNEKLSFVSFIYKLVTMDISYHFWFVYTLLSMYLLIPILKKFCNQASNKGMIYLLVIVIFPTTIGTIFNKFSGIWLFRFEPIVLGYFGYLILGYILGRSELHLKARMIIYATGIISVVMSVLGTYYFSTNQAIDAFFNGGFQINSYCIAASVFVLIKQLSKYIKNNKIVTIVKTNGALSFGVYLIHVLVLEVLLKYNFFNKLYLGIIFNFIGTTIISFVIIYLISKSKYLKKIF